MTIPELRQLAEDYLALPPGPYWSQNRVLFGCDEMVGILEQGHSGMAEAEARRLNAMPRLLRAAARDLYMSGELSELGHSIAAGYVARCEAHQRGELE